MPAGVIYMYIVHVQYMYMYTILQGLAQYGWGFEDSSQTELEHQLYYT